MNKIALYILAPVTIATTIVYIKQNNIKFTQQPTKIEQKQTIKQEVKKPQIKKEVVKKQIKKVEITNQPKEIKEVKVPEKTQPKKIIPIKEVINDKSFDFQKYDPKDYEILEDDWDWYSYYLSAVVTTVATLVITTDDGSSSESYVAPITTDIQVNNADVFFSVQNTTQAMWEVYKEGNLLYSTTQTSFTLRNLEIASYTAKVKVYKNSVEEISKEYAFQVTTSNKIPDTGTTEYNPDYTLGTPSQKVSNPYTSEYSWGKFLPQVNAAEAYKQGWTGQGVIVSVIDTGIDSDHTDLDDNIIGVYDTTDGTTNGEDDHGHGTFVAGIIAAEKNSSGMHGVAYDASIISIKAMDENGSGSWIDITQAIDISTEQNSKITNLSLGTSYWDVTSYTYSNAVESMRTALQNDNTLIVAAGNEAGDCNFNTEGVVQGCSYPAAIPAFEQYQDFINGTYDGAFVVVGSVNSDNEIADYSNKAGITKDWYIVAPGGEASNGDYLISTYLDNQYASWVGTSFASPVVAGAFALMAQKYPYLTGAQIRDIYFATATDLGEEGVDDVYGHGLINIEKAMQPIGDIYIPTYGYVFNTSPTMDVNKTKITSSTAFGSAFSNNSSLTTTLGVDSFNRAFSYDLSSQVIQDTNIFSFDNYKYIPLSKNLSFGINEFTKDVSLKVIPNENLSLTTTYSNDLIGSTGEGAYEFKDSKTLYNELKVKNNNFVYSLTHAYGTTNTEGIIKEIKPVNAFGLGLKYENNNHQIGVNLPLRVYTGSMVTKTPTQISILGEVKYDTSVKSLKPEGFQKDFFYTYKQNLNDFKINYKFMYTQDLYNLINNDTYGVFVNISKKF